MQKSPIFITVLIIISISYGLLCSPVYSANNELDLSLDTSEILLNEPNGTDTNADTSETLVWPVLPNESLNHIARMFYPNSPGMQKRFVLKTRLLNPSLQNYTTAETPFEKPVLIIVPSLKSLAIKTTDSKPARKQKLNKQILTVSYNIQKAINSQTRFLLDTYQELLDKNLFLKAQLAELNIKIGFLETKLDGLKLILDKTLQLPTSSDFSQHESINKPKAKIFVNNSNKTPKIDEATTAVQESFFNPYAINLALILAVIGITLLFNYCLKKYRQREFIKFAQAVPKMHEASFALKMANQKTDLYDKQTGKEILPLIDIQKQNFENTQSREAEAFVASSLEEAKLLVSINRKDDAIVHLKQTIETYPKLSINHFLYLLEIFKKLNAKEDFENYAAQLHNTFNVMTPVWYESSALIYVPQHLEEFTHIVQNLQKTWPSPMASAYLRNLITDNREGERVGFGKNVLSEILMLIEVLNNR